MTPQEVLEVRRSTGWAENEKEEGWLLNPTSCLSAVGVRDNSSGQLVGMGFIVGNTRHAVLCDFNVRPEHQGKGIGKAILLKRLELIKELGIPFVYTSLDPSNPLRKLYEDSGFVSDNNVYFWNRS